MNRPAARLVVVDVAFNAYYTLLKLGFHFSARQTGEHTICAGIYVLANPLKKTTIDIAKQNTVGTWTHGNG